MAITRRFIFGLVAGLTLAQSGIVQADVPDRFARLFAARDEVYGLWPAARVLPRRERDAMLAEPTARLITILSEDFPVAGDPTEEDMQFAKSLFHELQTQDYMKNMPDDDVRLFSNHLIRLVVIYHFMQVEKVRFVMPQDQISSEMMAHLRIMVLG
jgi:hypothetical protein